VSVGGSDEGSAAHGEGGRGAANRAARMGVEGGCKAGFAGIGWGSGDGGLAWRLLKAVSKAATGFSSALTAFSVSPSLRVSRSEALGPGVHAERGKLDGK